MPLIDEIGVGGGIAIASLFSGIMGGGAASKQARAQARAAQMQLEEGKRQFNLVWGAGENQRAVGDENLNALNAYQGPNMDESDPSYQWRKQQGNQALENYLSGTGRLGGSALRGVMDYNQGLASTEYANAYNRDINRMSTLAGYGPQGVQSGAGASANYLNSVQGAAQNVVGAGNAAASKYSAWNNAFQGGMSNYTAYNQNQNWLNAFKKNSSGGSLPMNYMDAPAFNQSSGMYA